MAEEKKITLPHHLVMEDRRKLRVSGVKEVDSFDDRTVTARTVQGKLMIQGEQLKVTGLELETGDLSVEGKIHGLVYEDDRAGRSGWFSGLFR